MLKTSYPMLVRTLANVVVLRVPGRGVWFTTMERGTYEIPDDPAVVFERLAPLAKSKLVIENEFVPDLEPELWDGDEHTPSSSRSPASAWTSSTCCRRRSRCTSSSTSATCAT